MRMIKLQLLWKKIECEWYAIKQDQSKKILKEKTVHLAGLVCAACICYEWVCVCASVQYMYEKNIKCRL